MSEQWFVRVHAVSVLISGRSEWDSPMLLNHVRPMCNYVHRFAIHIQWQENVGKIKPRHLLPAHSPSNIITSRGSSRVSCKSRVLPRGDVFLGTQWKIFIFVVFSCMKPP